MTADVRATTSRPSDHVTHYSFSQIHVEDKEIQCCPQLGDRSLEALHYIRYNLQTDHNTLAHYIMENNCDGNRH